MFKNNRIFVIIDLLNQDYIQIDSKDMQKYKTLHNHIYIYIGLAISNWLYKIQLYVKLNQNSKNYNLKLLCTI